MAKLTIHQRTWLEALLNSPSLNVWTTSSERTTIENVLSADTYTTQDKKMLQDLTEYYKSRMKMDGRYDDYEIKV